MTETLIALSFAHVLADFLFQTNWMAANKRDPLRLIAHIAVVLLTTIAAIGTLHPALFALAAAHLVLDAGKAWAPWKGLAPFLLDQTLHAASLVMVALWVPDLWAMGSWGTPAAGGWTSALWASPAGPEILPTVMVALTGLIVATRAGGFAIGLFMAQWTSALPVEGLPNGGRAIGLLERGLIFLLVIVGLPEGIGFLIAAKSVLRFGAVGDDRAFSEYVIIGTLASFAWAMTASFLTVIVLQAVSPIGIPDLSP